jgi:hypothetical protein
MPRCSLEGGRFKGVSPPASHVSFVPCPTPRTWEEASPSGRFNPRWDAWLGEDQDNPPEAVVPQLEQDRYYRWLTWATVPMHYISLVGCAWWVGTHALSWWAVLMTAYVAGAGSGLGINTGHELGHKHGTLEQWLARLVLAVPAYGHFTVEHGRGHHRAVSTSTSIRASAPGSPLVTGRPPGRRPRDDEISVAATMPRSENHREISQTR